MNKNEFLSKLDLELKKLPEEERRNAIQYYIEYFDDAGAENEQQVIAELVSPKEVASTILSNYAIKTINEDQSKVFSKKKMEAWKWVLIAIFAIPGIFVSFFLLIGLLGLIVSGIGIIVSVFGIGAGMSIGGLAAGVVSLILLASDAATGLLTLGVSLIVIAIGVLLILLSITITILLYRGIKALVTKALEKRRNNKNEKK